MMNRMRLEDGRIQRDEHKGDREAINECSASDCWGDHLDAAIKSLGGVVALSARSKVPDGR